MATLGGILAGVGGIALLVSSIVILIAAFKESILQGILVLLVPFYVLYYAFAKMEKGIWQKVLLGGLAVYIVGFVIMTMGAKSAMSGSEEMPSMPSMEESAPPAMGEGAEQ